MTELSTSQRLVGYGQKSDRQRDDFYATPPHSTEALLQVEKFDGMIWEPACGDGAISKVLKSAGYSVVSTDLVNRDYGNFGVDFMMEYTPMAPNVVTNPPFKNSSDFVRKALALTTGKVAMLLKIGFLEGVRRTDILEQSCLARVWVFRGRQSFLKNGIHKTNMNGKGGMIAFAWFVWEHGYQGKPTLGWI